MKVNKYAILVIYSLLFSAPYAHSERYLKYSNDTTICVEELENIGHLNFFTWSGKQILDFLARSEMLKEKEWKAIEMNPELVLHIKTAADLGLEISEGLCPLDPTSHSTGVYSSDDEVDAICHFVMSAYLAFKVGKEEARTFMAAHEDSEFESTNMMDYYNNELGFNFGESLVKKYKNLRIWDRPTKYFIEDIKLEIQKRHQLKRGNPVDFIVLKSGPSVCAQTKYPNF